MISGCPCRSKASFKRLNAEVSVHRVRQPPAQHFSRGPVHDRDQIQEPTPHRDERDVRAPDLVRARDCHVSQQIRIDRVLRVRTARVRAAIDRLQAHHRHQAAHPVTTDDDLVPAQVRGDLAAAKEWVGRKDLVDRLHQLQRLRADPNRRVVERRPAQLQQLALATNAEVGMVAADKGLLLSGAHLLNP